MTTMDPTLPEDKAASQGKIGRYVIEGELGRGAMGVVYRAKDPAIGRIVAVKTIRIGEFSDAKEISHVRDRMFREAQAAGILSNNNIVTIYDIQEESGMAYIFMEFVDGETLEKILLADTPIDRQLILHILRQTAEALDYAHVRGIVHRDIKPANIMVRKDGVAKIADFGIARVQSHSMTQTGQILGTPNYMSPEQISGRPVDGKADQYSLAVMLYEVLTGEKPFVADSLPTLLFKVVSEAPQPLPRLNPTLGPAIDAVLQRALAKNPAERFPTCSEMVRALENACHAHPGWTTLARGGGLSQATQGVPNLSGAYAPAMPTIAAHLSSTSGNFQPAPVAAQHQPKPVHVPVPRRVAPVEPQAARQPQYVVAIVISALVLGGLAFGGKLLYDRKIQAKATGESNQPYMPTEPPPTSPPLPGTGAKKQAPVAAEVDPTVARPVVPPVETRPPVESKKNEASKSGAPGSAFAIRTTPPGARVLIDDGKIPPCTSPCLMELDKGRHTATAILDDYRNEARIFNVPQESSLNITLEKKKGMLEVTSTPAGATITIDGNEHPSKTPALISLAIGKHTVTVTLAGKTDYSRTFEMRADTTVTLGPTWGN